MSSDHREEIKLCYTHVLAISSNHVIMNNLTTLGFEIIWLLKLKHSFEGKSPFGGAANQNFRSQAEKDLKQLIQS